jgi:putative membrane protein
VSGRVGTTEPRNPVRQRDLRVERTLFAARLGDQVFEEVDMTTNLRRTHQSLAVTAALAALLVGACSPADRADVDTALGKATDAVASAVDSVAGRVGGQEYTNAELVGFVNAYNDAEVEVGGLARTKATDPQVRDFARRIVTEHRALKTEFTNAAQRLTLTPTMPTADENLPEDHQAGLRDLNALAKGRDFDRAFVKHEIKMHRKVVDEVEDALRRDRNQEIRPVLEKARDGLRAHLTTLEELERKLGT